MTQVGIDIETRAFFRYCGRSLDEHAATRQLSVRRHIDGGPAWVFHFSHPKGGFGSIQLSYISTTLEPRLAGVWLSGHWAIDDYEKRERRIFPSPESRCLSAADEKTVIAELDKELKTVLSWDAGLMDAPISLPRESFPEHAEAAGSDFWKGLRMPIITN